jgi:hypothetical protein
LDYICDPKKTDERILISSFNCTPETADIEFQITLSHALDKGNNLGFHLIQSFQPGETSAETAHLIGQMLASEILQGKYEYVLATHVDKGHIHNHVIFCAASFVDHRKFVSNKKTYHEIRRVSDRLCREQGLSVIVPGEERGKGYKEYLENKTGTSWKAAIRNAVNENIERSHSFEEFLLRMSVAGFEIKEGKNLAFRAQGQQRFTRSKTLGYGYTEDNLKAKIKRNRQAERPHNNMNDLRLLVNLQEVVKAMESPAYAHVLKIRNLKTAAKTLNYLTAEGIDSYALLEKRCSEIHEDFEKTKASLKAVELKMNQLGRIVKNLHIIERTTPFFDGSKNVKPDAGTGLSTPSATTLHAAATKALMSAGIKKPYPSSSALLSDFDAFDLQKESLYRQYQTAKKEWKAISTARKNVDQLLSVKREQFNQIIDLNQPL